MRGKRHYIPIVPDKPKPGPKITRLFSWKKHKAETPVVETPEAKPKSKVWRVVKYLALTYLAIGIFAGVIIFMTAKPDDKNYDDDPAYVLQKAAIENQKTTYDYDNVPIPGNTPNNNGGTSVNTPNNGGTSGYCSTDSDCAGFGSRNGGIAICGSDRLCHICYSLRGETCVSCSTGCDANTYCEKGVCVFSLGGRTTD